MRLPFDNSIRRRIYLMRHGDVAYFDAQGQRVADSRLVVLTDKGRNEALAMRDLMESAAFDRAICSGLPRTVETAGIVLGGRTLSLETMPELEEIRGGTPAQRATLAPYDHAYAMFLAGGPGATYAAGEALEAFHARVTGAFEAILRHRGWTTLLLVAHGGVNRAILSHIVGSGRQAYGAFEQDTCCLNVIDVDMPVEGGAAVRVVLRAVNVTAEAPAKVGHTLTTMERLALKAFPHVQATA